MNKRIITVLLISVFLSSPAFASPWRIYFTAPERKSRSSHNPESGLMEMIKKTKNTFFGAFYDISSMRIADQLVAAAERGVDVRIVTETDNYCGRAVKMLVDAGIPVVTDNSSGLMHNKFAISDNRKVFTGSYNTTDNGSMKNNNNSIVIDSEELADIYLAEFQEMFGSRIFSNRHEKGAFAALGKKYYVRLRDVHINVYFSPEDGIEKIIMGRIKKAKKSIMFMAFSFTSDSLGEAMIEKFRAGVSVQGIFEKKGAYTKYSEFIKMKLEGVPVKVDRNRHIMHHKVIIIDNSTVITGSFNFSENADKRNDENILIIQSPEIAAQYLREFRKLYSRRR